MIDLRTYLFVGALLSSTSIISAYTPAGRPKKAPEVFNTAGASDFGVTPRASGRPTAGTRGKNGNRTNAEQWTIPAMTTPSIDINRQKDTTIFTNKNMYDIDEHYSVYLSDYPDNDSNEKVKPTTKKDFDTLNERANIDSQGNFDNLDLDREF